MVQPDSNSKKGILLVLISGIALLLLVGVLWARHAPDPVISPVPVAHAPEPPPAIAQPVVAAPSQEPAPGAGADSLKAALLGLDKKARPAPQAAAPKAKRARPRSDADQEQGDDRSMTSSVRTLSLSDDEFHATIERWRGMKSCLNTHKTRAAEDASGGALRISLKISGEGEVVESRVFDESNELAKMVARCVEKQAKQLHFPRFEGEESVVKEAKFVF